MSKLKIGLYIGSWPQNIGNAFFDLGALAILKKAVPDAEIHRMGGAVHWMFNASERLNQGKVVKKVREKLDMRATNFNSFEIGQFAEVDLLVFAGMSMCEEFIESNGRTFMEASNRGIPTLLLGTGGSFYSEQEAVKFSEFLNSLCKTAVITRDEDSFKMFNGRVKEIYSGMDCAFFLPDYYQPAKLHLPEYNVECFDEEKNFDMKIDHKGRKVLRAHHDMWGPLRKEYINKPMTLVSDVPEDYLSIYSQSKITYSDRVHACVATLAYGNEARLFSKTPRKALFERVGVANVTKEVVKLDQGLFAEMKKKQVDQARAYIEYLTKK